MIGRAPRHDSGAIGPRSASSNGCASPYEIGSTGIFVRIGDSLIGVLTLYAPGRQAFSEDHGRLVQMIAPHLAQAIARALGTTNINVTIQGLPVVPATSATRTYATVGDIESQLVNARVWIGFHYRHSVIAGEDLGNSVAAWTLDRYFLPKTD